MKPAELNRFANKNEDWYLGYESADHLELHRSVTPFHPDLGETQSPFFLVNKY